MIERTLRLSASLVGALLWLCVGFPAHAQSVQAGRIPVKLVAGRLVARCDISTELRRIPVNLFVEYDNPCGLELHNRAAEALETEREDGSRRAITIHFQGDEMRVAGREPGDEDALEAFTKWYSTELGDNPVVGTLGAAIMADHHLVFDLGAGVIEFGPPRERESEHPVAPEGGASVPISVENELVWLPVLLDDGVPRTMALGTSRYDTIVDEDFCELRGRPAGDLGTALIGDTDLGRIAALRPHPVPFVHRDDALGVIGIGVLQHLRVDVDRANRWVTITPVGEPEFPAADRAFFEALVSEEPGELLAYLESHPESRCAREAADLLLDRLITAGKDGAAVAVALEWNDRACPPDLRATTALERVKELRGLGMTKAAVHAGELGVAGGRDDRYPDAVHQLHAELGTILLERGESREAWKHLLSAAFGLPEDGMVNLQLGRFYEQEGRHRRAFSRYVQAVIRPESSSRAMEGLARLQAVMSPGEALSIDLIERLIAGKIEGFGAATKYEYTPETDTNRVVLIEHLTNAHEEAANGGALGLEGVLDHFGRERVAVISYHLAKPEPDPLHNAAAQRADLVHDAQESMFVINGRARVAGRARTRQKEELYGALRGAVIAELARPSDYELTVDARVAEGVVTGEVTVEGPAAAGIRLELWLVERGVLFPGKSKVVIHRMVVRDSLLDSVRGEALEIDAAGAMTRRFERSLAEVQAANESYLLERQLKRAEQIELVSTAIDPAQVAVVAVLRRSFTGEVLQACYVEASSEERQ